MPSLGKHILQQHLKGVRVTLSRGVADNVDRVTVGPSRRQDPVQTLDRLRRQLRHRAALFDQPLGGQDADTAAIGQDRQAFAWRISCIAFGLALDALAIDAIAQVWRVSMG